MDYLVGIGEYLVTADPKGVIKTFSLSTCVAVVIYCPLKKAMGLLHIQLPDSTRDPAGALHRPGRYADTGIDAMLADFKDHYGCRSSSLNISIFGGLESLQDDLFQIGPKNVAAVKKKLAENGLRIGYQDTGGQTIRTLFAYVADGAVDVFTSDFQLVKKK